MRRALAILGFLMAGHAVAAGVFWALLNVPESSVPMLGLSALLAALVVIVTGWTEGTAAAAWRPGVGIGQALWRGVAAFPGFLVAAAVFGMVWWVTGAAWRWHADKAGEIDAWLMMQTGSARTAWAHATIAIGLFFLRYVVGLSIAAAILGAAAGPGLRAVAGAGWIGGALSRRQIGSVGLAVVLLMALPLRGVYWRPEGLPPTALEVGFAAAKLAILYIVVHVGWSIVLWSGARSGAARRT